MKKHLLAILVTFIFSSLVHSREKVDGIAAVVGDSVILKSELDAYIYLKLSQTGDKPDSLAINMMRYSVLDEMIDGKVLLVHAEKDTNISISEADIEAELENRINYIMKQNKITLDQLKVLLEKEQGVTFTKFKKEIKKQIKSEIIKQKIQYFYVASQKLSNSEIVDFYNEYKDSLPAMGKSILLQKLEYNLSPSKEVREKAYAKISHLREQINNGVDFSDLAKKFSEGPNAKLGGELGYIEKGTIDELDFEEKIFSLKPGDISQPFETRLGFHIVSIEGRKGQAVKVRQIFVSVEPDKEKKSNILSKLDSLSKEKLSENDFIKNVKLLSNDEQSKSRNGLLTWKTMSELSDNVKSSFSDLSEGKISNPIETDKSVVIYRIKSIDENRKLSLSDDWNSISQIAKRIYEQKKMIELVEKWRIDIYIEKRL